MLLPWRSGFLSSVVGRTFSLAESDTKKANGTSHRQSVKYAMIWKEFYVLMLCYVQNGMIFSVLTSENE